MTLSSMLSCLLPGLFCQTLVSRESFTESDGPKGQLYFPIVYRNVQRERPMTPTKQAGSAKNKGGSAPPLDTLKLVR
jgi:hypothetical protein